MLAAHPLGYPQERASHGAFSGNNGSPPVHRTLKNSSGRRAHLGSVSRLALGPTHDSCALVAEDRQEPPLGITPGQRACVGMADAVRPRLDHHLPPSQATAARVFISQVSSGLALQTKPPADSSTAAISGSLARPRAAISILRPARPTQQRPAVLVEQSAFPRA